MLILPHSQAFNEELTRRTDEVVRNLEKSNYQGGERQSGSPDGACWLLIVPAAPSFAQSSEAY